MNKLRSLRCVLFLVSSCLIATSTSSAQTVVLDQEFDPTGQVSVEQELSADGLPEIFRAQTFTAGASGTLASVDVFINALGNTTGRVALQIRETTSDGFPVVFSDLEIQTIVDLSTIPVSPAFVSFDLSSFDFDVTQGDELAIMLYLEPRSGTINWAGTRGKSYLGGSPFRMPIPSGVWIGTNSNNDFDLGFRTFVSIPFLLGDCDQDGVVGFADIPAFIAVLQSGAFLQQADTNEDNVVNFGDIPSLIAILANSQ